VVISVAEAVMDADATMDPFTYLKRFEAEPVIELFCIVCGGYVAPARIFAIPTEVLVRTDVGLMLVEM
jgi:hypothetical protein